MAPGWEAWAAQGLGAASSAEAQEHSDLRMTSEAPCFLLGTDWQGGGTLLARGLHWAPAAAARGVCVCVYVGAGGHPGLACSAGTPTLCLSLCPSGPGPHSPSVYETEVSEGKLPDPRILPGPTTLVSYRRLGMSVGTGDTVTTEQLCDCAHECATPAGPGCVVRKMALGARALLSPREEACRPGVMLCRLLG